MKVELSNQELIDIYSCIGAVILNNSEIIDKQNNSGKKFNNRLEEENRRLMELTPKVFKLIDWGNN
ncbi:hypothetical protein [Clostridium paraputrificum]|uniref:hypothetical protein n=1 Tax=Clostridium paraputrificum TaxID=29363 RepID=UPI000C0775DF|nr:hypothetical protein [Clostridium paraputrificum]